MSEFNLFAHGEEFDVDAFLSSTTLRPDHVWRRGEQRPRCVESRHETSGVEFVLGDGQTLPLTEQESIALTYLQEHRDELRALKQFPGARVFILGLQYNFKLDPDTVGFCVDPSAVLMRHAHDIGIHLSYYVRLDRWQEWGLAIDPPEASFSE